MNSERMLAAAARLHDAGDFDAAQAGYMEVVAAEPRNARAHFLLGLLETARSRREQALLHLQHSLDIAPAQADVWRAVGDNHLAGGDSAAAAQAFLRCVQQDRSDAIGWFKLAHARQNLEQFEEAEKAYRRATRLQPVFPEAWCNLGNVLSARERFEESISSLRRALAQRPRFAEAWRNLGVVLDSRLGRREEALECFERACAEKPDYSEAHFSRGAVLGALGRTVEAVQAYERVFELDPSHAGAYNNLGIIYLDEWLLEEARLCFERAIAAEHRHAEALNNLGNVHLREQQFHEAAACFARALEIAPQFVEALNGAGLAAQELGLAQEAAGHFDAALALRPGFAEARANRAMASVQLGDVVGARQCFLEAAALSGNATLRIRAATLLPAIMGSSASIQAEHARVVQGLGELADQPLTATETQLMQYLDPPFYFAYRGWNNREALGDLARLYRRMVPEVAFEAPHVRTRRTRSKVRVGFVSNYFFRHSVGMSFVHLFRDLATDARLELVGISLGVRADDVTQLIRGSCAGWVDARGTLAAVRSAITALELDVLFFTDVGMDRITYPLALSRLARVQCLSGGHPETTGSPEIDYLLSSRWLETPAAQAFYTERLVLLDAYNSVLTRPEVQPGLLDRQALNIAAGTRVYVCPVKLHKLHPEFDAALAAIVERDPGAQIVLFEDERQRHWRGLTQARLTTTMGAAARRVRFEAWADLRTFQSWLHRADAVLDCWPFGMGTTAISALGQGVPVITLPSERLSGRGTQALLRMMDLPWPIAADFNDYVDKALKLAAEPDIRRQLAQDLAARSDLLFQPSDCATRIADFMVDSVLRKEAA